MSWFLTFLYKFFTFISEKCFTNVLIHFSRAQSPLVHQQRRIFNIIAFKVFQAISEVVRGNMEPCRWKFDRIMIRSISRQPKEEMFHTRLNDIPRQKLSRYLLEISWQQIYIHIAFKYNVIHINTHFFFFFFFFFVNIYTWAKGSDVGLAYMYPLLSRCRFCIALYGRSGNKRSNLSELKSEIKFWAIKAEEFQAPVSSYWPNVGAGIVKSFKFLTSWQAPGTQQAVLTSQIRAQQTVL